MTVDATVALITLQQAKDWLKITLSSEDTLLEGFVNRAGDLANTYCSRHLKTAAYVEYYDGDCSPVLRLRQFPVTALTTLNVDPSRQWGAESLISISDNVQLDGPAGIVRLWNQYSFFARGAGNVKVAYTAGYKDSTDNLVPYDLQEAAMILVMHSYKRHYQDGRIGLTSETVGDRTYNYSEEAIPKKAKLILDQYRSMGAGSSGY